MTPSFYRALMAAAVLGAALLASSAVGQDCTPTWSSAERFGDFSVPPDAMMWVPEGGEERLYAVGSFAYLDGQVANGVARWRTTGGWEPLPQTGFSRVAGLIRFDDGSGEALYLFGQAAGNQAKIIRWDGFQAESLPIPSLGSGTFTASLAASLSDASGPALYIIFSGNPPSYLYKWQSGTWSSVPFPLFYVNATYSASVSSVTSIETGPARGLYAAGGFTKVGTQTCGAMAKWDGASWTPINTDTLAPATVGDVRVTRASVGGQDYPYFAGPFGSVSGTPASGLARWDGAAWHATAPFDPAHPTQQAYIVGVDEQSDVHKAFVEVLGVDYTLAEDQLTPMLAQRGPGNTSTRFIPGGIQGLGDPIAFGRVEKIGGRDVAHVAQYRDTGWEPVGEIGPGFGDTPSWSYAYRDASGPKLLVGGHRIWDGQSWTILPPLTLSSGTSPATAAVYFDDGSGPALYVGTGMYGGYSSLDGVYRLEGAAWHRLSDGSPLNSIFDMCVFNDGMGDALFASGQKTGTGSSARYVVKWNRTAGWVAVGGFQALYSVNDLIGGWRLAVFDDGSGPRLLCSGIFQYVVHDPLTRSVSTPLVVLSGDRFVPFTVPTDPIMEFTSVVGVSFMQGFTDVDGTQQLFITGNFTLRATNSSTDHRSFSGSARLVGGRWTAQGGSFLTAFAPHHSLAGDVLYGTTSTRAGLLRWTQDHWTEIVDDGPLSTNLFTGFLLDTPPGVGVFDDGQNTSIFVSTNGRQATGGYQVSGVARYDLCPPPCLADFNHDGGVDGSDIGPFFDIWSTGVDGADLNHDGGVDGQDVREFFVHWQSGC